LEKSVEKAASIYSGRTILTPYAKILSTKTIESYLKNIRQEDCYQAPAIPETDKATYTTGLSEWFDQKPEKYSDFKDWYLNKPIYHNATIRQFGNLDESERLGNFNYSMIQMLNQLEQGHFLSQALSGFNNALLMHHQTLQLPIADPLGFADYQTFTTRIREAIGTHTNVAPLPLNDFLPLRSGTLRLLKLRITDTFGQHKDIEISNPIKAETSRLPENISYKSNIIKDSDVWLPPRFIQPARVNFRWLSADHERQELNSHPDSSPICGWLLANHLDNSMAVYDQQGNTLGYIDQEAQWRSNPGSDHPIDSRDLPHPTLVRLVERLSIQENDDPAATDNKIRFFQDFISVTDKALESIDPESFIHHQELALLMGRPIAVVRATLGLELQASPAIHRGWTAFRKDLLRNTRETDRFEEVKIPMRIGEQAHRNDGVVGYWKEEAQELDTSFYTITKVVTSADNDDSSPADSVVITSDTIKSYQDEPLHLAQSFSEAAQQLTLLIDPRAEAHVTTGVLPVKRIHIPKDQYAPALKKISINFLSTPILMPANKVMLPLPSEHGYDWSWLAKDRFSWTEVARQGILRKDTVIRTVKNGAALWQQLLDQGWLIAIDTNRARVVPSDQRTGKELQPPFAKDADRIQQMLDAGHILPVHTQATFDPQQTIKEGWLKLSPIE
jgi:predicted house-cleaning NTP pyrophosphatase (Maf/HAM1 superfamily)